MVLVSSNGLGPEANRLVKCLARSRRKYSDWQSRPTTMLSFIDLHATGIGTRYKTRITHLLLKLKSDFLTSTAESTHSGFIVD